MWCGIGAEWELCKLLILKEISFRVETGRVGMGLACYSGVG